MAKQVEIPEDLQLTSKEYNSVKEHLRNSVVWYATNMAVNSAQIIDKLKAKGLPEDLVTVTYQDGHKEDHDLTEECLTFLKDSLLLDDEAYARRLIERTMGQGKGSVAVRGVLRNKKVDDDLMDNLLEEYNDSQAGAILRNEGLAKVHRRALSTNAYKKEVAKGDEGKYANPRNALVKYMASRGYGFQEINDYLDELEVD